MSDRAQVLLYTSYLHIIGGIETFVYNFIELMGADYEIGVYCPKLPQETANRIREHAKLFQDKSVIECDTLIMVRMMDDIPYNIRYLKSIRMCHACKVSDDWQIKQDCDYLIHVSNASKTSFKSDGGIIYNPLFKSPKKSLLLVSATRIPALDKGLNADRMLKLATMLNDAKINFVWLNFSDAPLQKAPKGFVNVGTYQDIQPYISKADYLVQLSDQEGFGYSVLEALINNTAVICTPFSTTKELGVKDGENGYIIPFNMQFDVNRLLNVPIFSYQWDNSTIKQQWAKLFNEKPKPRPKEQLITVRVITPYRDILLDKDLQAGEILNMRKSRAEYVKRIGYIEILGGK